MKEKRITHSVGKGEINLPSRGNEGRELQPVAKGGREKEKTTGKKRISSTGDFPSRRTEW